MTRSVLVTVSFLKIWYMRTRPFSFFAMGCQIFPGHEAMDPQSCKAISQPLPKCKLCFISPNVFTMEASTQFWHPICPHFEQKISQPLEMESHFTPAIDNHLLQIGGENGQGENQSNFCFMSLLYSCFEQCRPKDSGQIVDTIVTWGLKTSDPRLN